MLRSAASKAMWVGRTTAAVIGLAIALAIVFGVATMALAAVPGDPFKLGQVNSINRVSTLVGSVTGPMLRVENQGTGTALNLRVQQGKPPLTTNSTGRVPHLNSDMVDGKHAGAFLPKGGKAADADKLDGLDSTEFYAADSKVADADKLDGKDSTDFALGATVRTNTFTVPINGFGQGRAECQPGEIAVGGGFNQDLGSPIKVNQNMPYNPSSSTDPPTAWYVGGYNENEPSSSTYKIYVVCAKG